MPPRNSITKPFKKYSNSPSVTADVRYNCYDMIEKAIFNPKDAVNNSYSKEFNAYRSKQVIKGLNITNSVDLITKTDSESDQRYVNTNWYKSRNVGDSNAWKMRSS